ETTVRRVLGRAHDAASELLDPRDRLVGVAHGEVDRPVRRLVAGVGRVVHDPRELPLTLPERRVAELVRVAHRVHVPAEDVAVEGDGRLVRAGVKLEPGRSSDLAGDLEALLLVRLPGADVRATRIGDHRGAAVLADDHRRELDLPAVLGRRGGDRLDVVRHEVDAPRVRIPLLTVIAPADGELHARTVRTA